MHLFMQTRITRPTKRRLASSHHIHASSQ